MSTATVAEVGVPTAGIDAALTALASALDAAQSLELWPVQDRDLAAAAVACGRLVSRTQAWLTQLVGELDARDIGVRSGASSTTAWVRHELNVVPREARTLVQVGAAVRHGMGVTGDAFRTGDLGLAQAAVVTDTVAELPADLPPAVRARAEADLVAAATHFDAQQLTRLGRHILTVVAPEIGEARDAEALAREDEQARRRRELFFTPDGHGTVHLRGRLTDEAAAVVRAALEPWSAPLPRTAAGPDPRTAGQRRADALAELARRALTGQSVPATAVAGSPGAAERRRPAGPPAQVVVTIPLRVLTDGLGTATLSDGTPLSPGAARRMACDADLVPAVLGSHSAVLDVGRSQRLFTGARRRALILRDRGCAFPGCDRPPEWCEGHHILGFAHGGATDQDNGVLLCVHHHHVVHDDGWDVALARDGVPEFTPPAWIDPTRTPQRNHRHGLYPPRTSASA